MAQFKYLNKLELEQRSQENFSTSSKDEKISLKDSDTPSRLFENQNLEKKIDASSIETNDPVTKIMESFYLTKNQVLKIHSIATLCQGCCREIKLFRRKDDTS